MSKFKKNGARVVKINPTSILETIRKQLDCPNLYTSVEDDVVLTLDLEDCFIYFVIEQINLKYRLTTHTFSNTITQQSTIRQSYNNIDELIARIVKYTITKTKLKGIPCKLKSQSTR